MEDGSDTEPEDEPEETRATDVTPKSEEATPEVKAESPAVKEEVKEEELDPSLAEWFTVDADDARSEAEVKEESGSETEPDSENEDVKQEDVEVKDEDEDDSGEAKTGGKCIAVRIQ